MSQIDSTHPPVVPRKRQDTREQAPRLIRYVSMPDGSEDGSTDWMRKLPVRYQDGQNGFDRRLMEELAAVAVPTYTVDDLANGPRTIPQGIPIFIDWLAHLETKIPGPETRHRGVIRTGLIRNLIDPAARGNQAAFDVLLAQLQRTPALPRMQREWAVSGLGYISQPKHFDQIVSVLHTLPADFPKSPLIQFLGKVHTEQSRDVVVGYLDSSASAWAIKALVQMKATGVRHLIEPFTDHHHAGVRKAAKRAMERLPS